MRLYFSLTAPDMEFNKPTRAARAPRPYADMLMNFSLSSFFHFPFPCKNAFEAAQLVLALFSKALVFSIAPKVQS